MRTRLFLAAAALIAAPFLHADNFIVMKYVETFAGTFYNEDNPVNDAFGNNPSGAIPPTGYAPSSYSYSNSHYLIINLTTSEVHTAHYYVNSGYSGYPATKVMFFTNFPQPLSNYFRPHRPLKAANSFLWNNQSGDETEADVTDPLSGYDSDGDGTPDSFNSFYYSDWYKGTGTPLVVTAGVLTIPNVPRSITGKSVRTVLEDTNTTTNDYGNGPEVSPPWRGFSKQNSTITITLDSVLSVAANKTAIAGTTDLGLSGSQAPGTLGNARQRVRNLLFSQGYRIQTP